MCYIKFAGSQNINSRFVWWELVDLYIFFANLMNAYKKCNVIYQKGTIHLFILRLKSRELSVVLLQAN